MTEIELYQIIEFTLNTLKNKLTASTTAMMSIRPITLATTAMMMVCFMSPLGGASVVGATGRV